MEIPFVVHIYIFERRKKTTYFILEKNKKKRAFVAVVIRDGERERFQKQNYTDTWNKTQKKHVAAGAGAIVAVALDEFRFLFFLFSSVCSAAYCFVCLFWFSFSASITRLLTI